MFLDPLIGTSFVCPLVGLPSSSPPLFQAVEAAIVVGLAFRVVGVLLPVCRLYRKHGSHMVFVARDQFTCPGGASSTRHAS